MKKSTFNRLSALLLCIPLTTIGLRGAITHGSIKGTNVTLYAQGSAGGNAASINPAATLDYKVVTKGTKSWAYLKFNGTSGINAGADWQTQLRYWSSTNAKTENNLTVSKNTTTKTVLGTTSKTIPSPLKISFFQDLSTGGFSETLLISYDVTAKNSPVTGDVTAPSISACDVTPTETDAALTITGSDDSGDLYYYITDAAHGIEEFALSGSAKLSGLTASTTYNLTITPIDFNGNEGTPLQKSFTTGGLVQIMYGEAKDIWFMLKSSGTQLEYYYEFTDATKKFRDAFLKILPAGGTEFEVKPTLSPDSTSAYGVCIDAAIANKVLTLNCGYFIYVPGDPVWADYVMDNKVITAGTMNGTPIKHQMGGSINPTQAETTAPALSNVSLLDVTGNYVKLAINGTDNSGSLYYNVTGAKQDVTFFRNGTNYLTAIEPNKTYTLTVTAKDFSGNASAALTQKVKTMKARTNLLNGNLMKYNSTLISSTGSTNELAATIQVSGNTLTVGCNTSNTGLTGTQLNRKFYNASVKINGTSYPLTLATPDSTSAQAVFTDVVGTQAIANGNSFTVQFSVFWTKSAGNFFTGSFTYNIGDNGQTDTEGPTAPVLRLNGNTLSWNKCTDALTGVKCYTVTEAGQTPVRIFDFDEASFTYTMTNPTNAIEVAAVDFLGNQSKTNQITSGINNVTLDAQGIYPNPANHFISLKETAKEIVILSLQGQSVLTRQHTATVDISSLQQGYYLVRWQTNNGTYKSAKLQVVR